MTKERTKRKAKHRKRGLPAGTPAGDVPPRVLREALSGVRLPSDEAWAKAGVPLSSPSQAPPAEGKMRNLRVHLADNKDDQDAKIALHRELCRAYWTGVTPTTEIIRETSELEIAINQSVQSRT